MYDYMTDYYEEAQELLREMFIDDINWLFVEAFDEPQ